MRDEIWKSLDEERHRRELDVATENF